MENINKENDQAQLRTASCYDLSDIAAHCHRVFVDWSEVVAVDNSNPQGSDHNDSSVRVYMRGGSVLTLSYDSFIEILPLQRFFDN